MKGPMLILSCFQGRASGIYKTGSLWISRKLWNPGEIWNLRKGICGDYNNVVGLPVGRLVYELKKMKINIRGMRK